MQQKRLALARGVLSSVSMLAAWLIAVLLAVATFGAGLVGAQADPAPKDAAITAEVERAFAGDEALRRMDIRVETEAGVVSLTGFVRALEHLVRASELARAVEGVSAVRNRLRLVNPPSRA